MCEIRPRLQLLSKDPVWLSLSLASCMALPRTLKIYNGRELRTLPKPPSQSEPTWYISAASARILRAAFPYTRTKGLGEIAVLEHCPSATIIRPSLVFGPEDDFFNVCLSDRMLSFLLTCPQQRFSRLSKFLPFLPVFGGGASKFQPIYVDDLARAVEIIATADAEVKKEVSGKIMEAGGPDGEQVTISHNLPRQTVHYSFHLSRTNEPCPQV